MLKTENAIIREACVDSLEDSVKARDAGAERIELCSRLDLDGLTPSLELMEQVLQALSIPVHVMIRTRGGDFNYSRHELEQMKQDIDMARELGAAGVVFGLLDNLSEVNIAATAELVQYALPLKITFHKAVDMTPDPVEAVKQLRKIDGITGILTSGGSPTAEEGVPVLREMIRNAGSLEIIVAGKVTRHNLAHLHSQLNARAYHGKRIVYDA